MQTILQGQAGPVVLDTIVQEVETTTEGVVVNAGDIDPVDNVLQNTEQEPMTDHYAEIVDERSMEDDSESDNDSDSGHRIITSNARKRKNSPRMSSNPRKRSRKQLSEQSESDFYEYTRRRKSWKTKLQRKKDSDGSDRTIPCPHKLQDKKRYFMELEKQVEETQTKAKALEQQAVKLQGYLDNMPTMEEHYGQVTDLHTQCTILREQLKDNLEKLRDFIEVD